MPSIADVVSTRVDLKSLETRGFVHIPRFLTGADLQEIRDDASRQPLTGHYNHSTASVSPRFKERIDEVLRTVGEATDLHIDLHWGGIYFATGKGINFPWHQDHEAYFSFQDYYHYLNFYIPVVKPRRDKSNLSIIPFDVLRAESPKMHERLVGHGASRFIRLGNKHLVFCDESGIVRLMPTDLERIAHTPQLEEGDLLLLRGDIIHRTEDTDTDRVALSFRASSSTAMVTLAGLADGSTYKARMMAKNPGVSQLLFKAFDAAQKDRMQAHELLDAIRTLKPDRRKPRREFMMYLLERKRRSGVLAHYFPRALVYTAAMRYALLYERLRARGARSASPADASVAESQEAS